MEFKCQCGGTVKQSKGIGRTFPYRIGTDPSIPDDFEMPTCDKCGEHYFNDSVIDMMEEIFAKMAEDKHGF